MHIYESYVTCVNYRLLQIEFSWCSY